eukprot:TRINITY_DN1453_c0_g1_i1.p1 TRINITY_DN1453_c0_g1~~TRINITY_DN1453_c0_g1_i1.p1  ORF type:complete len:495 (-),score=141.68 TRINITY_DN1453_c0_g1_i1:82-1533(-)
MGQNVLFVALLLTASVLSKGSLLDMTAKMVAANFNTLERFFSTHSSFPRRFNLGDISVECGICGIAVNEIEGFTVENITEAEIEDALDNDICTYLSGEFGQLCKDLVGLTPKILAMIESGQPVGVVCVNLGYCTAPITEKTDPQPMPEFVINLDLAANDRWTDVCSTPVFQNVTQWLINTANAVLPDGGTSIELLGETLNNDYFPPELAQEIQGCAASLGISVGWLTMMNLAYEISDACTSIVAQTEDGKILHARNLDFWDGMGFTDSLKDLAFQADYQKGGNTLFYATTFSGFVGVLSGFKPNAFSMTIDTRFYPDGLGDMFYEVIAAITEKNASLVTFLSRDVFTNENDFDAALENLSDGELIADVYYILAGVSAGEGAVISRNRLNASDVWLLDADNGRWFEVQTNYDHWEQPPWFDNRVTPANNAMNAMGRANLTLDGMFEVLTVKPVLNLQTTYTILACPADGTYQAYLRYCPYPCVE